ncbi:MAG: PDZ domain-containing protein [Gammaproteobacteria bacterium]|nr:PDZ domain-containing protein [Gammaproteobacteria bacterium]MYF02448.1 PDZ domain-containing protein [Gammaproteobacteria bacterium]MYI76311.1 PDZ domain-containing protein [Gammaproteobacteria bacterium]
MKALQIIALFTLFLLGLNGIAKDNDDSVTTDKSQKVEATKELIEKETLIKELEAALEEKQRAFDEKAAELKTARNQLIKESAILREATDRHRTEVEAITSSLAEAQEDAFAQDAQYRYAILSDLMLDPFATSTSARIGYIGVQLGEATDSGIPIVEVFDGTPANIAGVQVGDVILSVVGVEVDSIDDSIDTVLALIASYKPGSVMQFTVQRDSEEIDLEIATIARNLPYLPSGFAGGVYIGERRTTRQNDGVIGVLLGEATDSGVPIQEVYEGAPADIAGIQADDEILAVGDIELAEIDNPTAFTAAFFALKKPGSIIRLAIERDRDERDVSVAVIDRNSLYANITPSTAWSTSIANVLNPEIEGFARVIGDTADLLSVPSTDNKIFVMEIEEEFGGYFNVEFGVLVLNAEDVEEIQAGDILLEIDEKPVRSLSHAFRHKQDAESEVEILLKRNKREKTITLDKDEFSLHAILE